MLKLSDMTSINRTLQSNGLEHLRVEENNDMFMGKTYELRSYYVGTKQYQVLNSLNSLSEMEDYIAMNYGL